MKITRRIQIRIETLRRTFVAAPAAENIGCCPFCSAPEQPLLTTKQAAEQFKLSRRVIYHFVEIGAAHFVENQTGEVLLCPASLAALMEKQK